MEDSTFTAGRLEQIAALGDDNPTLLRQARRQIMSVLNRGEHRRMLALAASAYITAKQRELCTVSYHDGRWIHRYHDRTLVAPDIMVSNREYVEMTLAAFYWAYRPQPGDTVMDVGAGGIGDDTIACSRLIGPTGRLVAIEAHPVLFDCLEETCRRNELRNVTPLHLAAWNEPGTLRITDSADVLSSVVQNDVTAVPVPASTLDQIADDHGIGRVALLRMNIEGAERQALAGATGLLARTDHVVVSCHDFRAETADDPMRTRSFVETFLRDAGFETSAQPDHPINWVRDIVYARR